MEMKIKYYQLKNVLIKLDHTYQGIINNLKKSDKWKIQLTVTVNFFSSEDDNDEECVMDSKSGNIEIIISDKVAKSRSSYKKNLLKSRYQNNLESMRSSEFVLDYIELLYN